MARKVSDRREAFLRTAEEELRADLEEIGIAVTNDVKRRMQESVPRGRIYVRGRVTHQASAPGQPPAIDTGEYWKSIGWQLKGRGQELRLSVGSRLDARMDWLEFGTSQMAPRPHWRPAWRKIERTLIRRLTRRLERAARNA